MSATGLEVFDATVHKTNRWLKEIMQDLDWEDRHRAYLALRATLHALRDRLTVEEVAHLGAQLPMLIRGFYYEGWDPTRKPEKIRRREEFLERIAQYFVRTGNGVHPEPVVRAVFAVLGRRVSEGEIEDVKRVLPEEIRDLWP
ncbi:MAG TPA: DUF2267 domain-containing protein [Thermoanaerobaculia bacterium]|jgi:uncharacterized protein (DUF2267 family)